MYVIIKLFVLLIVIISIAVSVSRKKEKNVFLNNMKLKTNQDLISYILKMKPTKISIENINTEEELRKLKLTEFHCGNFKDKFVIDDLRVHENFIIIFISCKTFGYVGLVDKSGNNFYNISAGSIPGENILPAVRRNVFLKLNIQEVVNN